MNPFYGNSRAMQTLTFAVQSGRLCHAYLIEGEDGTGKTAFAKRFAAAALCTGEGEKPCGVCPACYKTERMVHPDLHFYPSDGKKNSFHVKTVREIKESVYTKPNEGQIKVYLLCRADCMTAEAQNALLKMLEEPPGDTLFLLTCRSRLSLPETVLSRCIPIVLSSVSGEECTRALTQSGKADEQTAKELAERYHGNIGQALDTLENARFQEERARKQAVLDALVSGSEYALLKALFAYENKKPEAIDLLDQLGACVRDAAALKLGEDELIGVFPEEAARLGEKLTLQQAQNLIALFAKTKELLDANANLSLTLTALGGKIKEIVGC